MSKIKLEKGDKVVYKFNSNEGEWAIILDPSVKEDENGQLLLIEKIKIQLLNKEKTILMVYEHDLFIPQKGITYLNTKMLLCDCGLKYVRDGGRHSHWCLLAHENKHY